MSRPTAASPLNNPSHSELHNFHVNVKMFGATGDGTTDDTAAIQAAYNALGSHGTLYFPEGVYKISSAIAVGSNSAFTHRIQGATPATGGASASPTRIRQTSANANIFTITQNTSQGNSIAIEDMQLRYDSVGTGVAVDVDQNGWTTGPILRNMFIQNAGTGLRLEQQVQPICQKVDFNACTIGVNMVGGVNEGVNLPTFENCTWHACTTAGIRCEWVVDLRMTSCILESNTGPDILIPSDTGGAISGAAFVGCWWEASSSNFIRIAGQLASTSGGGWVFTACNFQNNQHLIEGTTAPGSNAKVSNLTFIGCGFTLSGKNITKMAQTPTGSGDPSFGSMTFIGCTSSGSPIQGVSVANEGSGGVLFQGVNGPTSADLVAGDAGFTPYYVEILGGTNANARIKTNGPIILTPSAQSAAIYHELQEQGTTDAVAGAANTGRLFVKDNGSGKTQLCVRFNTGAAQVIATEP